MPFVILWILNFRYIAIQSREVSNAPNVSRVVGSTHFLIFNYSVIVETQVIVVTINV